ncbi:MAG: HEAT repeat domain-containing protein [Desulfurococcales archaeon]|nr:HEAT repeat domain-containing protein [Desulfurococcales archaeon]
MGSDLFSGSVGEISRRRIFYLVWLGINKPELLDYVSDDSLTEVVAVLGSSDWRIKAYATLVLGMMASRGIGLPEYVISEIIRLLSDSSEYVRSGVAWILGKIGNSASSKEHCKVIYDSLARLLNDSSWVVRAAAVNSLGELRRDCNLSREVVKGRLYDVLVSDKSAIVRKVAYNILKSYGE